MTSVIRRPLASRAPPVQIPTTVSPLKTTKGTTSAKRPRSPDAHHSQVKHSAIKRTKCAAVSPAEDRKDKEKRKGERDALKEEFRVKYTKAFPSWTFYFDTPDDEKLVLSTRVLHLNGRVADFFANDVTHFISNRPIPTLDDASNKENTPKVGTSLAGATSLKSPIKLRGRGMDDGHPVRYDVIKKAMRLGMKIWDTAKLNSVLNRCFVPASASAPPKMPSRSLTQLLESERRYGTSERDPTQKRHDFRYFSKNSYFVLVEDIPQEFATIAAKDFPITRTSDGREKGDWPVLYCHPLSRGPFVPYNEKEERRREKHERMERERERQKALELNKIKLKQQKSRGTDLRRSVSMNNFHRQAASSTLFLPNETCCESSAAVTADASGYLASMEKGDYVAASGNSVGITSTYGTTSAAGRGSSHRVTQPLSAVLRGRLQNQVITSRKASAVDRDKPAMSTMMPPPAGIPARQVRKSKSTNTLRLPKRDEDSKPGYCECCRCQFEDFRAHVKGKKHSKFAANDAHFLQLDYVLERVKRRTIWEAEAEKLQYLREDGDEEEDEQKLYEDADMSP